MAPNLQKSFAMQNRKQRMIAIALVVVLMILVWQIFGLFFTSPPPAPHKNVAGVAKAGAPLSAAPPVATTQAMTRAPAPSSALNLDPTQQKYLQLLEEYKIVELQKMIATDKQAIAAAQASTMESLNKISQLGGQSNLQSMDMGDSDNAASAAAPKASADTDYTLEYTGLEDNNWTATLKKGDSTYDVMIGTIVNGKYKVTDINSNEVVLESDTNTLRLSFDGNSVTPLSKSSAPPAPPAAVPKPVAAQGIVQTPTLPNAAAAPLPSPAKAPAIAPPKPMVKNIAHAEPTFFEKIKHWVHAKISKSAPAKPIIIPPPPTPAPLAGAPKAAPITMPAPTLSAAPKTVMDLDPNTYALQLAMLASKEDAQSFVKDHRLTDHYFIYQEKAKPRYFIIYGSYASKDEAQKALATLPNDLQKAGPYPVAIKKVQEKISH